MILLRLDYVKDKWKNVEREAKKQGLKNPDEWDNNGLGKIGWVTQDAKVYLLMNRYNAWVIRIVTQEVKERSFAGVEYVQCVTRLIEILKQHKIM